MDRDTAAYIFRYYNHFMTPQEHLANRHLMGTMRLFFLSFPFQSTAEAVSNGEPPHSLYSIRRSRISGCYDGKAVINRCNSHEHRSLFLSWPHLILISDPAPRIRRDDRLPLDVGLRPVSSACYRRSNGTEERRAGVTKIASVCLVFGLVRTVLTRIRDELGPTEHDSVKLRPECTSAR